MCVIEKYACVYVRRCRRHIGVGMTTKKFVLLPCCPALFIFFFFSFLAWPFYSTLPYLFTWLDLGFTLLCFALALLRFPLLRFALLCFSPSFPNVSIHAWHGALGLFFLSAAVLLFRK